MFNEVQEYFKLFGVLRPSASRNKDSGVSIFYPLTNLWLFLST